MLRQFPKCFFFTNLTSLEGFYCINHPIVGYTSFDDVIVFPYLSSIPTVHYKVEPFTVVFFKVFITKLLNGIV